MCDSIAPVMPARRAQLGEANALLGRSVPAFDRTARALAFSTVRACNVRHPRLVPSLLQVFEPATEQRVADAVSAHADRNRLALRRLMDEGARRRRRSLPCTGDRPNARPRRHSAARAAVDALADKKRQLAREQRRRSADVRVVALRERACTPAA